MRSEAPQRETQESFSVTKKWSSANGFIFYCKAGEVPSNRREDKEDKQVLQILYFGRGATLYDFIVP